MAGGTWLAQNKVRPGAYINFKAVPRPLMTVGARGIGTIAMPLSWGPIGELIDVYSTDLINERSLYKVGFTAFDAESKLLNGMLSYCYMAKVFRMDRDGIKATATIDNLLITAKYEGTFGNNITISVVKVGELFDVTTFVNGIVRNKQRVAEINELEENQFVIFSINIEGNNTLSENAGIPLTGGFNGTVPENIYIDYKNLLRTSRWQTLALPVTELPVKTDFARFIKEQREDEGRYVQVVMGNYDTADYEGIINVTNSCIIDGESFTPEEFTAIVAGMTAGATVSQSNTGRLINGATQIIGELDNFDIIEALQNGKFLLSTNQDGKIKVEQDINSLHTFTQDRTYAFSKNRVIRTLDEIGTTVKYTWESFYMGKVSNNENGRSIFKGDLISYLSTLQSPVEAIQEFAGADDVKIEQGNELDAVVVELRVKPVDSMEKLYMTVNVVG